MPERNLIDSSGESFSVIDVDGTFMFKWPNAEQNFKSMPSWKARDEDIILCSYPKSGVHWMYEIVGMLINGSSGRIKEAAGNVFGFMTESYYNNMPSPRIMNNHFHFRYLPNDTKDKKCRLIFIARNPKDVMVSFYHHHSMLKGYGYQGKWNNYFNRFMDGLVDFGSWFDYMNDWEKVIEERKVNSLLIVYYEDLVADCTQEIKRIAKFLDVPENICLFSSIKENCSFDKLKADKDKTEYKGIFVDEKSSFYRKGVVGDWRNWFTVAQNEHFDHVFQERMKDSKFRFKYSE